MKTCISCGVQKDIDDFYRNARSSDGHQEICKACNKARVNAYRLSHKESIALRMHNWREKKKYAISERLEKEKYIHSLTADDEDDLAPMVAGGFVRWAVITSERRRRLGEMSPFNGQSVLLDPPEPDGFDEVSETGYDDKEYEEQIEQDGIE